MQKDCKGTLVVAVVEFAKGNLKSDDITRRINQFRNMLNLQYKIASVLRRVVGHLTDSKEGKKCCCTHDSKLTALKLGNRKCSGRLNQFLENWKGNREACI